MFVSISGYLSAWKNKARCKYLTYYFVCCMPCIQIGGGKTQNRQKYDTDLGRYLTTALREVRKTTYHGRGGGGKGRETEERSCDQVW